ncbi:class I SAM-dependent methyltransferase [Aquariibacter lacus]|uniref:class I SAM-dependent methyltransferase n=1 Tax=Aquariibacter lacus TaxID=2801332 RepID=UPI0025734550|nr:class I SAM-dependent methyltransferase [Piscinibacter lacus]
MSANITRLPEREPVSTGRPLSLAWPLPAVAAWTSAWALQILLGHAGLGQAPAALLACLLPLAFLPGADSRMRQVCLLLGYPVMLLGGLLAGVLPAWVWLLPLGLLLLLYPRSAWRDAPLYPTPAQALDGLAERLPLPAEPRILDAGCGLGDGLKALRGAYPDARLEGIETSLPLSLVARLRCRGAAIRRGDLWGSDWEGLDMVYLFQRPESMPRALAKAQAELEPGAWLLSLAFPLPGMRADLRLPAGGHTLYAYRAPFRAASVRPLGLRRRIDEGRNAA